MKLNETGNFLELERRFRDLYIQLLIFGLAFFHAFIAPTWIIDDAYISFRYAANFADGYGLVFNQGEKVEGYSNLLWTLLLSGAAKLQLNLPITSWCMGVVAMLLTIWATMHLARLVSGKRSLGWLGGLALACSFNFVGSSIRGLETALFAAFIVLALLGFVGKQPGSKWLLAGALAGLSITRPKGLLLSPFILTLYLYGQRRELLKSEKRRGIFLVAGLLLGFLAAVVAWRKLYYDEFLPMSVIAKRDRGVPSLENTLNGIWLGLEYVVNSLGWLTLILLTFSLILVATNLLRQKQLRQEKGPFYMVSAVVLAFGLIVAVSNKGDWMPYARLLTPYFPVLVLFFVIGINDWASPVFAQSRKVSFYPVLAWIAVYSLVQPINETRFFHENIFSNMVMERPDDQVGVVLGQVYRAGDLDASGVLGRIGYYSRPAKLLDMLGLTSPTIARWPETADTFGKRVPGYVADLKPVVIEHNYWPYLQDILGLSKENYVGVASPTLTEARIFILVRSDAASRIGQPLIATFGGELLDWQTALDRWRERYPDGQ